MRQIKEAKVAAYEKLQIQKDRRSAEEFFLQAGAGLVVLGTIAATAIYHAGYYWVSQGNGCGSTQWQCYGPLQINTTALINLLTQIGR